MVNEDLSWQDRAACQGADTSIFFNDHRDAKLICGGCEVKGRCLEYALLYNMSGTWGGLTESERSKRFSRSHIAILRDDAIESGAYNFTLKA